VPGDNFVYDPESGRASILYQGRRWYPDEGRVPGDVQDREAWLLEAARPYWRKWAKQELAREGNASPTPEEFEAYVRRALDQLLDWGGPVTAGDGRYRMEGGWQDNQTVYWDAWHDPSQYAKVKVLTLRNHFDVQRDWQLEFTVAWDRHPADENGPERPLGPSYFSVSAGRVQAGLLFIEPQMVKKTGKLQAPYGKGAGVAIFESEDLFESIEDEFLDFHWHIAQDKKHRKSLDPSRGKAYVDDFKYGSRYRVRLERIRDEIHFWAAPLETLQDGNFVEGERYVVHVSRKFPAQSRLRKALAAPLAGEAQPVFRFFSFVRCDLEDVKVSGILAGSGDG